MKVGKALMLAVAVMAVLLLVSFLEPVGGPVGGNSLAQASSVSQGGIFRVIRVDGYLYLVIYQPYPDGTLHVQYFREDNTNEFMGEQVFKNGELILDTLRIRLPKNW